jgi:hypothetical protein
VAARLRDGLGWFVLPDGGLVPFGDYHTMMALPSWTTTAGSGHAGLRSMRDSGYATVKLPHSYLATEASFFFPTHKHADEPQLRAL